MPVPCSMAARIATCAVFSTVIESPSARVYSTWSSSPTFGATPSGTARLTTSLPGWYASPGVDSVPYRPTGHTDVPNVVTPPPVVGVDHANCGEPTDVYFSAAMYPWPVVLLCTVIVEPDGGNALTSGFSHVGHENVTPRPRVDEPPCIVFVWSSALIASHRLRSVSPTLAPMSTCPHCVLSSAVTNTYTDS